MSEENKVKMEQEPVAKEWSVSFKYPIGAWAISNLGVVGLIDFAGINGLGEKEYLLRPKAVDNKMPDSLWVNEKYITLI